MSDSDEFEYESDDVYGGSGQEDGDEEAILIENIFYEADDNKQNFPEQAVEQFLKVVEKETARGTEVVWRFKALQNIVILCARIGRFDEMPGRYRELLSYMDQVTRNDASDAINTVLDSVSGSSDLTKLETIYELTLDALRATANQRLWFSTCVKLAKLHLEMGDMQKLQRLICTLHKTCQKSDGTDDVSKGSHLLEVYALEIQMCTVNKNTVKLKEIYPKTINLTSAIADPRNIAVIRESGGKMFMGEKKWEAAYNEFFEAYEQNDIQTIDKLLTNPSYKILSDAFIRTHLQDLLRNIRLQVLQNIIKPYRAVSVAFLAEEISVPSEDVISLLVQLILDEKIAARIDGPSGYLHINSGSTDSAKKFASMQKWVDSFERIHNGLLGKLNQMNTA